MLHTWEIPVYPYMELTAATADLTTAVEQAATKRLAEELARVRKELPRAKSVVAMGLPWQQILDSTKQLRP